jgi:hypothetical protein
MSIRRVFSVLSILQWRIASVNGQGGLPHEVVNVLNATSSGASVQTACNNTVTESIYITEPYQTPTTTRTIHSIVFPSPNASPIEITTQSQVITSYMPEMTWCVAPAIFLYPVTGPPYSNGSTSYRQSVEGTGKCETVFAPVKTTICATTLTGLGSRISVTKCDQEITFSTEYGFTMETPTPTTTASSSLITPARLPKSQKSQKTIQRVLRNQQAQSPARPRRLRSKMSHLSRLQQSRLKCLSLARKLVSVQRLSKARPFPRKRRP